MPDQPPQTSPEGLPDKVFGRRRTPRTLIMTDDDDFAAAVSALVPTSQRVNWPTDVEQAHWDLLVTTEPYTNTLYGTGRMGREPARQHLYIVSFVTGHLGSIQSGDDPDDLHSVAFAGGSQSTEYALPGTLQNEFRPLVESSLLPTVQARTEPHPILAAPKVTVPILPLLKTTLGHILAFVWIRPSGAVAVALPPDVGDRAEWVRASLKFFQRQNPDRFQEIQGWEERRTWSTAEERRTRRALVDLDAERQRELDRLAAKQAELRSQLAAAVTAAESGLRRLLTVQSTDLEAAVADALRRIGFEVERMDDREGAAGNLGEDLRVTDPDVEDWEALAEVKGYRGGARVTDLAGIARHIVRYVLERGHKPSAVWYVANQFANQDPELRPPMLASQEDELEQWASEFAGLAVDTAELFQLVTAVEEGDVEAPEARRMLRESTVRFTYRPGEP